VLSSVLFWLFRYGLCAGWPTRQGTFPTESHRLRAARSSATPTRCAALACTWLLPPSAFCSRHDFHGQRPAT
jgi:hypothetical protein